VERDKPKKLESVGQTFDGTKKERKKERKKEEEEEE
jgi:hypothetical protein